LTGRSVFGRTRAVDEFFLLLGNSLGP